MGIPLLLGGLALWAMSKNGHASGCSRRGCQGIHCAHPGHEWFCLNRYKSFVDNSGRYYCDRHFRAKLSLPRRDKRAKPKRRHRRY